MRQLLTRLTNALDVMCEETDAATLRERPELADRADAAVRRRVIEATFRRVLHRLGGGDIAPADAESHTTFGAAAAMAGIPLEHLTAGYRVGVRVGWAHIRAAAQDAELDGEAALLIAQAQLAYVDELTADTFHGYRRAVDDLRTRQFLGQQTLIDTLLAGRATEESARDLGWQWPEELSVAVMFDDDGPAEPRPATVLIGVVDGAPVAIGPPSELDSIFDPQQSVVLGPAVPPDQTWSSFERARRLATLVATGAVTGEGHLRWVDELATVVVHGAPDAAAELAARRLDPLSDPSAQREEMLYETLAAWLDHPGQPKAIAGVLQLHPQTVRYRLSRLRERLGDTLDDPNARFELALALRYRPTPRSPATE